MAKGLPFFVIFREFARAKDLTVILQMKKKITVVFMVNFIIFEVPNKKIANHLP